MSPKPTLADQARRPAQLAALSLIRYYGISGAAPVVLAWDQRRMAVKFSIPLKRSRPILASAAAFRQLSL